MPEDLPKPIRRTIHFSGFVQGVGFRFTTQAIAARFPVTGFVRNLPDGRVELVAEGTEDDLERFRQAVAHAMRSNIAETSSKDSVATGEFRSFNIGF